MRRVALKSIIPGQRLAKTVYSKKGNMLLEAGIELSNQHIAKLEFFNIEELFIEYIDSEENDCPSPISGDTREEAKVLIRKIMNSNAVNLDSEYIKVEYYVNSIIDQLLFRQDIVISLNEIRNVDDYTFEHSVSVCIFSLIIGISLEYSDTDLFELGVGALLHDIGKLKIPDSILKKPSNLTPEEFSFIKMHSYFGYEILSKSSNISKKSAEVALYHHERIDGSGYPNKLSSLDIPEFARITAVADVFDALTSDRVYRNKLGINEVVEYMTSSNMNLFDQKMLKCFMKFIRVNHQEV